MCELILSFLNTFMFVRININVYLTLHEFHYK